MEQKKELETITKEEADNLVNKRARNIDYYSKSLYAVAGLYLFAAVKSATIAFSKYSSVVQESMASYSSAIDNYKEVMSSPEFALTAFFTFTAGALLGAGVYCKRKSERLKTDYSFDPERVVESRYNKKIESKKIEN